MGFKNNDRCLDRVGDSEPIFVLRAQDRTSLDMIHRWYEINKPTLSNEHAAEVRTVIDDFAHWQSENPGKVKIPD